MFFSMDILSYGKTFAMTNKFSNRANKISRSLMCRLLFGDKEKCDQTKKSGHKHESKLSFIN